MDTHKSSFRWILLLCTALLLLCAAVWCGMELPSSDSLGSASSSSEKQRYDSNERRRAGPFAVSEQPMLRRRRRPSRSPNPFILVTIAQVTPS